MPELPELEVVREVLLQRVAGRTIQEVSLSPRGGPLVARDLTGGSFRDGLLHRPIEYVERRGKFLVFRLGPTSQPAVKPDEDDSERAGAAQSASGLSGAQLSAENRTSRGRPAGAQPAPTRPPSALVANPKLTGRFQLCPPDDKKAGPVHVTLHFDDPPEELRYIDQKRMGQLYLTSDLARVPTFDEMGPDALAVSEDEFRQRLQRFRGEIKGVLARERFLAGIGNAYADEILWRARLHPYRKRTDLSDDEVVELYRAMRGTLLDSVEQVRQAMGEDIHLKPRDFFAVHMRKGECCPRCGGRISEITAGNRITNFCRSCQPGGLIRGM